jgi:hypothetical protein
MLRKVKRIKLGKQIYRRLMKRVLERDEWRCQKCGSLENLQVHHRIKRSQQGNDALGESCEPVCPLPPGGARTTLLYGSCDQDLQQAAAATAVKTLPAVISGVNSPRSLTSSDRRAREI